MELMELTQFKLNAYYQNVPIMKRSAETGGEQMGMFEWIDAQVPGSVYADLQRAGIIEDPYVDMNSLLCEWVPERWWVFRTEFSVDRRKGRHYRLHCHGIDYKANISCNHRALGSHEGMYVPFKASLDEILQDRNRLEIALEHAPFEHGQMGYTCENRTQKARFGYKWDFCVRMIGMGIYRPVVVEEFGAAAIEYADIRQSFPRRDACVLDVDAELFGFEEAAVLCDCSVSFNGAAIDSARKKIALKKGENRAHARLTVENPMLWWPAGYGGQPLYQVEMTLSSLDGEVSDRRSFTTGLRSLAYQRCVGSGEGALPYLPVVNGKPIYIKGVNMTPMDMNYGCVTAQRTEMFLEKARNANINLVRVWGGGVIESEAFYEACSRLGIMIWQEFIQSSSGINNVPSKDPHFLRLLSATAVEAVKSRRTYPALVLWSGGNELCDEHGVPCTFEDENIAMLARIVKEHDTRQMLPTSASGPCEFLDIQKKGRNHDVHGPWKFGGPEAHYALFNQSDSLLHSEFGVDGMANLSCILKTVSPRYRHVSDMESNTIWRHRGEWWGTLVRDTRMFGLFEKEDLQSFIQCSQYIQAEGLRYALEANRRRAFYNCGSIIWQFNEPYPAVSGTNLVDYYGEEKLAYYFVKDAYAPRKASMTYDKLIWAAGETLRSKVYVANGGDAFKGEVRIEAADWQGRSLFRQNLPVEIPANSVGKAGEITCAMPRSEALVVTLTLYDGKKLYASEYTLFVSDSQGFIERKVAIQQYQRVKAAAAQPAGRDEAQAV